MSLMVWPLNGLFAIAGGLEPELDEAAAVDDEDEDGAFVVAVVDALELDPQAASRVALARAAPKATRTRIGFPPSFKWHDLAENRHVPGTISTRVYISHSPASTKSLVLETTHEGQIKTKDSTRKFRRKPNIVSLEVLPLFPYMFNIGLHQG